MPATILDRTVQPAHPEESSAAAPSNDPDVPRAMVTYKGARGGASYGQTELTPGKEFEAPAVDIAAMLVRWPEHFELKDPAAFAVALRQHHDRFDASPAPAATTEG
jgi:hypothetical protein